MRYAGIDLGSRTIKLAVLENGTSFFPARLLSLTIPFDGAGPYGRRGV